MTVPPFETFAGNNTIPRNQVEINKQVYLKEFHGDSKKCIFKNISRDRELIKPSNQYKFVLRLAHLKFTAKTNIDVKDRKRQMDHTFNKMWKWNKTSRFLAHKSIDDLSSTAEDPVPVSAVPGKDPDFGTSAIIKTFYEGQHSSGGCYDWVDSPPKQLNKKVARAHDRVAIKIYKIKDSSQPTISGRTPLKIHEIELQSPILIAALKDILEEVDFFLETTEPAKFQEPFKPLFFCYDKIIALYQKADNYGAVKQHLRLLVQVMGDLFGSFVVQLKNLRASGLISYKLAWTYFPKDSIIYSGLQDCTRVCRVLDTRYECEPFPRLDISCQEISFDGESFAWKPITLHIPLFAGNLPVTALPNYPLSFHPDQAGIRERLTARGKKVLEYQELHYCEYSGVAIFMEGVKREKHNVS